MAELAGDVWTGCPLLMGIRGRRDGAALRVYCRLPDRRVRVPSRAEVVGFCADARHLDCATYRRVRFGWTMIEGGSESA
jgi:hypothetical protein